MEITKDLAENMLPLVPFLYVIGMILKDTERIKDKYIPLILLPVGVLLSLLITLRLLSLMNDISPNLNVTDRITTNGCTLFVFPYTYGLITYPSTTANIKKVTIVLQNKAGEITKDVIAAIALVITPPK